MGLLKDVQRNPEIAAELARCVGECRPFRLLDLKLYLTRRCNLRCLMCTAWTESGDGRGELGTAEVLRVVGEAGRLGLAHLKLFGGEPLLRRDLETIVAYAAGLGVHCTLITNGTMLTRQRAQALVAAGLAQVDLSLDAGDPVLHDSIRGVPGTWSRAVRGLGFVQEAARTLGRRLTLRVNTVVMRQNYRDLPNLVRLLSQLGLDVLALNPVVPQRDNSRAAADQYMLSREEIDDYNREIAPRIAALAVASGLSSDGELVYLYGRSWQQVQKASHGRYVDRLQVGCCFKPWYYLIVRESGEVVGCNTVKHPLARIGNVREASVESLWHSVAYQTFRARCHPPRFEECSRCCYRFALVNKQIGQVLELQARQSAQSR